jgi:16S rRNA C967 or C1407 C5-methylase (RsmB/RsmF family)/NOL1/NOP2/fmu family ribosome biogenesis protein
MVKGNKNLNLTQKSDMSDRTKVQLPNFFIERMKPALGKQYEAFEESFGKEVPVSVRLNPEKWKGKPPEVKIPWCKTGFYLEKRPVFTTDPWFQGGVYYVQEPNSMFLEQAFMAVELPEKALLLDLCAAPGGKTTHLLSLLRPDDLLVTNEVIRSRAGILRENVQKWGYPNVLVTQNDPQDFGKMADIFDLIVVDAPCSGEGLFRKDPSSMAEWSPGNTVLCASRQKRILAEAWKGLKPGGTLIYSTCTYNPGENEENLQWLQEQEETEPVEIVLNPDWNIREIREGNLIGYQFFPHLTRGEGFFLGMVRKRLKDVRLKDISLKDIRKREKKVNKTLKDGNRKTLDVLSEWISKDFEGNFLEKEGIWYTFPSIWMNYLSLFEKHLTILQAGTPVASGNERQMHPHPALALSILFNRNAFPEYECSLEEAIRYLKKDNLPSRSTEKKWMLVTFRDVPLGWLKNLGNRTNNYYPSEWRIRMNINELPALWHDYSG